MAWRRFTDPPNGKPGRWTEDVVVITGLGNVYKLAYYWASDGVCGVWQRPAAFHKDEQVEWWIAMPRLS